MKRQERVLLGAFITLVGIAIIAPDETTKIIEGIKTKNKTSLKNDPSSETQPSPLTVNQNSSEAGINKSKVIRKYGVIRRGFYSMISGIKTFWKWLW